MRRLLPLLIAALAFGLYLRTLVPDVFVSDFAEFQYDPIRLGLTHPNGFPLYMLLGWAISHLPLGTVAWRMNLLSAIGGALAVAVTFAFVRRVTGRTAPALLAGGLLALDTTFWYYSLAAERYTLNLALLAGAWWAAWEAGERRSVRLAVLSSALLGLGLTVHPSDALLIPFWLSFLVCRVPAFRRSLRPWLALALAGALPVLLYLYVPLRWAAYSDWPLLPGIARSSAVYKGMVHVWYTPGVTLASTRLYLLGMGGYAVSLTQANNLHGALGMLALLSPAWLNALSWPVLSLALLSVVGVWFRRRDRALMVVTGLFALYLALMVAYIGQGKNEAYLLPSDWIVYFWAAWGINLLIAATVSLWCRLRRRSDPVPVPRWPARSALALVVVVLAVLLVRRYPQADLSRWTEARRTWDVVLLHPIEEGAGLLGHWSDLTPLWYLQQIESRRTDLLGLFPPDPDQVIRPWLEAGKALYLEAPLHGYAPDLAQRFTLMPWGKLTRILLPGQAAACPAFAHKAYTPTRWPLAVTSWELRGTPGGDSPAALFFCWQAQGEVPRDSFLRLRLHGMASPGEMAFNEPLVSEWYPRTAIPAGSGGLGVVPLNMPLGTPTGIYTADLLVYRLLDDGTTVEWPGVEPIPVGSVTVAPARHFVEAALTDEVAPLLPLPAGPLALRAWRVSSPAVRPGDPIEVQLLWEVRQRPSGLLNAVVSYRDPLRGLTTVETHRVPIGPPDALAETGTLIRTVASLPAPRGRGDRTYLVTVQLSDAGPAGDGQADGEQAVGPVAGGLAGWLTSRVPLGMVNVHDRAHLTGLPAGLIANGATLGSTAQLVASRPITGVVTAGHALPLALYWRALAETDTPYVVFVHVLDAQDKLVAQHDGQPAGGTLPTNLWVSGEYIEDEHQIALPADLPPGTYRIETGLYSLQTMERLPVTGRDGAAVGDSITVGTVAVGAP
jgi:hypothetical protein